MGTWTEELIAAVNAENDVDVNGINTIKTKELMKNGEKKVWHTHIHKRTLKPSHSGQKWWKKSPGQTTNVKRSWEIVLFSRTIGVCSILHVSDTLYLLIFINFTILYCSPLNVMRTLGVRKIRTYREERRKWKTYDNILKSKK